MNSGLNVISHHNAFARRKGGAGSQSPASPEPILRRLSSGVRGRIKDWCVGEILQADWPEVVEFGCGLNGVSGAGSVVVHAAASGQKSDGSLGGDTFPITR